MSDIENQTVAPATETPEAAPQAVDDTPQDSLLEQIMEETRVRPSDEGYDMARQGLQLFISEVLKSTEKIDRVDITLIDQMLKDLDARLGRQVDEILHDTQFQELESAWTGLKFAVDNTDFRGQSRIKLEILNVSKEDLIEDFGAESDITRTGLYKTIYTDNYGQFGGKPVGAMIGNYTFGPSPQDVSLLRDVASVAAMAHAPFIAAAGPEFLSANSFKELPNLKDVQAIFEQPQYIKWNSFRETEDARYVGLTMPRFVLRLPYGPETIPTKSFIYKEHARGESDSYLWGNTAFAFATRLTDSFAKYAWCPNIIGPQSGGSVDDLVVHQYKEDGQLKSTTPTEVLISDRRELELAEQGFIPLVMRKDSDNAAFFSANSTQKTKVFQDTDEGEQATLNFKLGTQLPYMFIVNRLAHYLKVLQRENIGSWKQRGELQDELNTWIGQYVSDMNNPTAQVRSKKPLRNAKVLVNDVPGEPGWYRVNLAVQPHFKYAGADFTLSLTGRLDKD